MDNQRIMRAVLRRAVLSAVAFLMLLALVMFVPGGTGWWDGWLFLTVFVLQMALATLYLWHKNPEIFIARSKINRETKSWDKVVLCFLLLSFFAMFPLAGLDHRFHWSNMPIWPLILGYVLLTVGMTGCVWVEAVNKFAEPGVRIQTERGHKVIDTGPYAIVRHPFYVAAFFLYFGIALALGSFWALMPAAVAVIVLIVRTIIEDRFLQTELSGYKEYAGRVRYRLIPGVW